jgi:cell wall-associated NlpC family hydrolase
MTDLLRAIEDIRRRTVPDRRLGVFDVTLTDDAAGHRLAGVTTSRDALAALRQLAAGAELPADVRALPEPGQSGAAVVTAALAPVQASPAVRAERATEVLHGETVTVLERRDAWLRVRVADGYHGWLHDGYARAGTADWADDWSQRAEGRSLGAELRLRDGRARLPLGARLVLRRDGSVETADGRVGDVVSGAVRPEREAGAEARLLAPPEWALRWFGAAPYLWGGRTDWGTDCSGLTQAVYAFRGTTLPRDTDLQLAAGVDVPIRSDGRGYEAGDLLFFAEQGRVSHVALWAGAGHIVHSALSRGGVGTDDLYADAPRLRRLRDGLVGVRRIPR